ncbi:MFS transporter [Oharaeibacter diazotrophicus]|uniref:Sugar transport protein n=1 Tax=Oharaeibacter diazotrophicus TaxID=1920512 RepID=A0A4R6RA20_9HYPH|nr:MFS transporter [Oharaeibacter diazotrophicus]TDP82794.1 sugar transport protein [Oharaeibacter diazotrophicus]BBE72444.1 proline/betaine transporter [Pleomorphomonas sp. SM30]GLS76475.1 MFS transporter [Oharaeibacter diazotrophicus]
MAHASTGGAVRAGGITGEEKKVIFASSLGTVFEWYDFYLYGSLAAIISKQFFSGVNPTAAFIFALMAFAAGFAVRPFGALVFGRLGDLVGRKYTFLVTILIMGLSTFIVGILPNYETIGVTAPIILIGLRLLQGLALGGEYGGAATYVAEHAPDGKRGLFTSWIQTTATLGLFLSLLVILVTRTSVGEEAFAAWGWRIPFLVSVILLAVSVWIRMTLSESPAFQKMKSEGKTSKAPIKESFGQWSNLKVVILALFGLTAGQAVVWYTGQFYALFFLTQTLKVDGFTANIMIALSLAIGTPFFVLFGWLSDKIGRKPIIMLGCLLSILTYFPLFHALTNAANPALAQAIATAPVKVVADPATCSFQFNPVGTSKFTTSCDIAKAFLAKNSVNYENEAAPAGTVAAIHVGDTVIPSYEGTGLAADAAKAANGAFETGLFQSLQTAGYPVAVKETEKDGVKTTTYSMAPADLSKMNQPLVVGILFVLVLYVTMVYGPIAAMLVEMFPTRIRYTSMSLPYHIGNGWFGGFLPTTAFAMVAATGDIYYGLWYPIVVAAMTLVIGTLFVRETKDNDVHDLG